MKARLPLVEFDEQSVWDEIVELCSVQKKAKLLSRLHVLTPIWQVAAQRQVQFSGRILEMRINCVGETPEKKLIPEMVQA